MKDEDKTKEHLINELAELRQRITEVEASASGRMQMEAAEKLHREALRRSEERFRQVIDSISDHIYVTEVTEDGERINLYLSPHAETLTGYPQEKFIADWNFWPSTVIHPDDRAAAAAQAKRLAAGRNSKMEYRLVRADGQVIWVRDSARVQREGTSKITYGLVSDITERKEVEAAKKLHREALQKAHDELEQRVKERTADLARANVVLRQEISERKRVEKALRKSEKRFRQRAAELQVLYETSLQLNQQLEMHELWRLIVEQAVALLGAETGNLYVYDPLRDELTVPVGVGYFARSVGTTLKPGEDLAGEVFECKRPLVVADYHTWPGRATTGKGESHFKARMALPLVGASGVLGVLNLGGDKQKQSFGEYDVWLAELFAAQAAVALENARLYLETQRHAGELATLNKAGRAMTSSLDLNVVLEQAMVEVKALLKTEAASVLLRDPASDELVFAAAVTPGSEALIGTRLPLTTGVAGWVVQERQPVLVNDAQHDPRFYNGIDTVTGLTTRSLLAIPLTFKEKVIGVVETMNKARGTFDEHDMELLQALASSAAIAIENARLFEAERAQRHRTEALQVAGATVSSTLELAEVLDRLRAELGEVIPGDSISVFLVEADHLRLAAGHSLPDSAAVGRRLPHSDLMEAIEHSKRPLILNDARSDPRFRAWNGAVNRVRGWMGVPLLVGERLIGYFTLESRQPAAYTQADADLAMSFANQAAIAVENARLFDDLTRAQAQLIHRERLAALGQMAATVAHELRNPLTAIRMGVEYFLRDVPESDRRWRGAALMESNMDRIDHIIEDILFIARAPQPSLAPALLRPIIEEEAARWELILTEKRIACHLQLAADLPPLPLDPDLMARALSNLIGNSVDSLTPGGELHLTLSLADESQVISLADNGPGIPPKHLPRIFDPFFTTKSRGTGLGLSVVKQIVEYHRGHIDVWSELEVGTNLTITLPPSQAF